MKKTKQDLQKQSLELSHSNNRLILSFATGCGKSLASLKIAKNKGGRWYIIVAETNHIKNWHDEIVKHGYEDLFLNIEIFCYDSLHKYQFTQVEGIILDECHHITELRASYLKTIKFNYLVGLTATLPIDVKNYINYVFGNFYEFKYPLSQAIADGILPKPSIYVVGVDLTDELTTHVITKGLAKKRTKVQCVFDERMKYLQSYNNIHLEVLCTQKQRYQMISDEVDYMRDYYIQRYDEISEKYSSERLSQFEPDIQKKLFKEKDKQLKTIEYFKLKWLNAGSQRKRTIADIKTPVAQRILEKIKDKKLICFTGSIDQAKKLAFSKDLIVNSEKNKPENSRIIDKFNSGEIRALFATGMLREGMNLDGIESSLIVQLDNQTKSLIQMLGRSLRAESPECYILYLKGTQDEKYLKTAFNGFNKDYLYYTNINEL